jgi:L-rhamnose mutarotase
MSERIAFTMSLKPGYADEYRRRHDALWPELEALLKSSGIADYSIWLDPATNVLFATLTRAPDHAMESLPDHPVMRRWWAHLRDIMRVNDDGSPVVTPLIRMFHLP